ncbi:hypothetical protein QWY75_07510 [Pontixanthobacter aestiaquae]|uniref:Uncharacterized protein n=1 Tax=Pontixanthobacter aestiaquae TaxID=1509367 RepID=A0A844Z5C6_9SPHN|nr:hypothetical protein [Pontixanthobacter aestiaquae]MDN3646050.1 hypothetical protein [Pontixanthobacter aestiaquae]MXO82958.1 hypothetical protein [Pontixanthobacter aestiaquae]
MNAPLSPDAAAILDALKPERVGLSAKVQADLWVKLGIAAFSFLIIGGFSFIMLQISQAASTANTNSEKIDKLTENITMLVVASQNMQNELTQRGGWMDGQDLYSEQSRLKDQEHDQRLDALEARSGQ